MQKVPTGIALVALACGCTDGVEIEEQETELGHAHARQRLVPPESYVLASDGTTHLTLEQAGILKPYGRRWALLLGKALFWDQQVGSDHNACASCHHAAGADLRIRNQLTPGFNDVDFGPGGDTAFGSIESETGTVAPGMMPSGMPAGANYKLTSADFPLLQLEDMRDRNSRIVTETNDAISSQGSFDQTFRSVRAHRMLDDCTPNSTHVFEASGHNARQVEPRNTPTTINAAFFHSNFWDGRANNSFNGVGPFGPRDIAGDPNLRLVIARSGHLELGAIDVRNGSLASQAVAPPTSATEMSCAGRRFPDIGRKMLDEIPLRSQHIERTDSVLGRYVKPHGHGLIYRYRDLIEKAFEPAYWAGHGRFEIVDGRLVPDAHGYTQAEMNFSMFWGIAIMIYEQTLISDQSRFDDWFESCRPEVGPGPGPAGPPIPNPVVTCHPATDNPNQSPYPTDHGFTAQEALGFGLFNNGGVGIRDAGNPACSGCHPITSRYPLVFPTFSEAAFQAGDDFVPVERTRVDDPGFPGAFARDGATHQRGFFSLGLRDARIDPGNGGFDIYGNPLSIARMFLREQAGMPVVDPTGIVDRCNTPTLVEPGGTPPYPGCPSATPPTPLDFAAERHLVDGTFKAPSIRNVGLTPPYFHYGGYATLRSVVEVYARGGSPRHAELFAGPGATGDWSGTGPHGDTMFPTADYGTNVDFFIRDLKSTDEQIDALVAFLLTTTDHRVQCDMAPFDHPELVVTNGHRTTCTGGADDLADDLTFRLPAVGRRGYVGHDAKYCIPNAGDLFAPGMSARRGGD